MPCLLNRYLFIGLLLTLMLPLSAYGQRLVEEDTTQDGGTFAVSPPGELIVSHVTNNPLLTLTGGATTTGIEGVTIGAGADQSGRVRIEDGSSLFGEWASIGNAAQATGAATVTGAGSQWQNIGGLLVGDSGTGTLDIADGGLVTSYFGYLGFHGTGTATVTGAGSQWRISGDDDLALVVGYSGTGTLNITDGGSVTSGASYVGHWSGGAGTVNVSGAGAYWGNVDLIVGDSSTGTLNILDGGEVNSSSGTVIRGTVLVSGEGSQWRAWELTAGGRLDIANSGRVISTSGYVYDGTATVSGEGSQWHNSGVLAVGRQGMGTLNIIDGGLVQVGDSLEILSYGTLAGDGGTVLGDVTNLAGRIAPGSVDAAIGTLTIDGDLTQAAGYWDDWYGEFFGPGRLAFELASAASFDQLLVTGQVELAGIIDIDLIDGFSPVYGDEFKLMDFTSFIDSGFTFDFTGATLANPDWFWDTSSFATDGTIRVAAVPEPSAVLLSAMAGLGLLGLVICRRTVR